MIKSQQISNVWLKAAILGATWAASEIILGSFLHNLRIPFNGNILTAIGLILMISASFIWKDKGLFWRTGLICALMKTMSPSAVIFGPMIAIFAEAVLMDISIRTLGRNVMGYILGASLAMSWILVQKIANFILFYGFNIVEIYTNLMGFAERQLKAHFDLVWLPIVILLVLYILFGLVAVWIGMNIGRQLNDDRQNFKIELQSGNNLVEKKSTAKFPYSLLWLALNFMVLIGMLFVFNTTPIYIWTTLTVIIIFIWTNRYKRAIKQLSKPKFWLFFILITMLTAFVMTYIQDKSWIDGLMIGLQMNFRAAIVIVGFAVIGTELYNPKIRQFFTKTSFKQLPVALELAFEALPSVIGHLPEVRQFFKRPVDVIKSLIFQAENRFDELKSQTHPTIFMVTGNIAEGKTSVLKQIVAQLKTKGIKLTGFYAPRLLEGKHTVGYQLHWIETNETFPFLTESQTNANIGRFSADQMSIDNISKRLSPRLVNDKQLIAIDEVGRWELNGKGWFTTLEQLLNQTRVPQVWAVRKEFVDKIISQWQLNDYHIFDIEKKNVNDITEVILSKLKTKHDNI